MRHTQNRARGYCCNRSQAVSAAYRAEARARVRRAGRCCADVALLTPPGLDGCPSRRCRAASEGERRGGHAMRSRVREGRGATRSQVTIWQWPRARLPASLPHGLSSAVSGGHSEEGMKWPVRTDHSACCIGDALQSGGSILSSPPSSPSYSFPLSPGSEPLGLLASRTLQFRLCL